MKKLQYLIGLIIVSGLLFTSCAKDDEEQTPPSLNFLGGMYGNTGVERTDGDVTMETGKFLVFGFSASSTTDKNLASVVITRNYENVSEQTIVDSTLSVSSISFDIETVSHPNTGSEVFQITVTDRNGMSASISFTVTTIEADPGINIYNGIELGSFLSTTNSSFASITGETYTIAEADADPAVQAMISWVYFEGVTFGHTVMSPANATVIDVYPSVESWTNRNTTLIAKTSLPPESFDLVINKNQLILTIQNSGSSLSEDFHSENQSTPSGFEVNDVIAFETSDGHQGLIKITEVNTAPSNGESTIKYNVKVEK